MLLAAAHREALTGGGPPDLQSSPGAGSPADTGSSSPGLQAAPRGAGRRRGLRDSGPAASVRGAAALPGRGAPVTAGRWTLGTGPAGSMSPGHRATRPSKGHSSANSQTPFSQLVKFSSLTGRKYLSQVHPGTHNCNSMQGTNQKANTSTAGKGQGQKIQMANKRGKMLSH